MHFHGENTRKIKSGQCKENSKKIFSNWGKIFGEREPNVINMELEKEKDILEKYSKPIFKKIYIDEKVCFFCKGCPAPMDGNCLDYDRFRCKDADKGNEENILKSIDEWLDKQ